MIYYPEKVDSLNAFAPKAPWIIANNVSASKQYPGGSRNAWSIDMADS